jgi:hypothetical protein
MDEMLARNVIAAKGAIPLDHRVSPNSGFHVLELT